MMTSRAFVLCVVLVLFVVPAVYFPVCLLAYQTNCGAVTSLTDQVMLMTSHQRYLTVPSTSPNVSKESPPFLPEFKNPCYLLSSEREFLGSGASEEELETTASIGVNRSGLLENDTLRCLPYYFVIGWMKCGTTELFQKMMSHPDIMRPPKKEPAWFDLSRFLDGGKVQNYVNSHDALVSHKLAANFRYYGERIAMIFGDHSTHTIDSWGTWGFSRQGLQYDNNFYNGLKPNFAYNASSARIIHMLNPDSKFIVIMRNPVSRVYSFYRYLHAVSPSDFHNGTLNGIAWWRTCRKEGYSLHRCMFDLPELHTFKPIQCTWLDDAINATRQSLYYFYLNDWVNIFPRQQFLFLKFEEFIENPNKSLTEQVFPFLGLRNLDFWGKMHLKVRHGFSTRVGKETGSRIQWFISHEKMLKRTESLLQKFYTPHNVKLAKLLRDDKFLWDH